MKKLLSKWFKPDFVADSVCDIDLESVRTSGISGLILDIDNTLVPPGAAVPDKRILGWLNGARDLGFSICILSNAGRKRCTVFSGGLGIPTISNARKPGKRGYQKALRILDRAPGEVMAIGDQLFTDVCGAKRLGIRTVYTKPFTLWEVFTVMFKRVPEYFLMKILREKPEKTA